LIGNISEKPAASIFKVETYQAATWISHTGRWEWAGHRTQDWAFSQGPQAEYNSPARNEGKMWKHEFQKLRFEPMLMCTLFNDSASSSEVSYVLNKMW